MLRAFFHDYSLLKYSANTVGYEKKRKKAHALKHERKKNKE
jgi:hypothetical protein